MSNFGLVFMLFAYSFVFGCIGYRIYKDHKETERLRKERLERDDLCLCKHERWYHHVDAVSFPKRMKCYQFREPQDKLVLCDCSVFKRDNLLYLERLVERG